MTLRKQLFISITVIFLLLLGGSLLVNLENAQKHLKDQLAVHAEETATSLAFSLSNAARDNQGDLVHSALANSMIDVIYDSGYYQTIVLYNTKKEAIIVRERLVKVEGVPQWFVDHFDVPVARGAAVVVSGWKQLGQLEVVMNPGLAYRDLWSVFLEQSGLFLAIALLAYILAAAALKILLKPLHEVEKQAEAICRQEFIEQPALPRTRELRHVVMAINRMARKLKDIFSEQLNLIETLRIQSYTDSVTQLSNRNDFNARLQSVIDHQEKHSGVMVLMQLRDFSEFNNKYGREAGDECLRIIAQKLQSLFSECTEAILGRRGGADFAIYLPGFSLERSKALVIHYLKWAENLDVLHGTVLHVGISYTGNLTADHQLFNEADLALSQAQSQGNNTWQIYHEANGVDVARQARHWFATLQRVLEQQSITFHYQPVFDRQQQVIASEVLCRIQDGEQLLNAGVFFPMVERFNLSIEFDKCILNKIAESFSVDAVENRSTLLSINLSAQTILSEDFPEWLEIFLRKNTQLAKKLVLETAAHSVAAGENQLRALCDVAKQYGTSFALDHFGVHSATFSYLHSLPLRYLKIDRVFIKNIHQNFDNQFFVKSLSQIAHSRDVLVYAEGVETEREWIAVIESGLDGGQGFYLGKPAPRTF